MIEYELERAYRSCDPKNLIYGGNRVYLYIALSQLIVWLPFFGIIYVLEFWVDHRIVLIIAPLGILLPLTLLMLVLINKYAKYRLKKLKYKGSRVKVNDSIWKGWMNESYRSYRHKVFASKVKKIISLKDESGPEQMEYYIRLFRRKAKDITVIRNLQILGAGATLLLVGLMHTTYEHILKTSENKGLDGLMLLFFGVIISFLVLQILGLRMRRLIEEMLTSTPRRYERLANELEVIYMNNKFS